MLQRNKCRLLGGYEQAPAKGRLKKPQRFSRADRRWWAQPLIEGARCGRESWYINNAPRPIWATDQPYAGGLGLFLVRSHLAARPATIGAGGCGNFTQRHRGAPVGSVRSLCRTWPETIKPVSRSGPCPRPSRPCWTCQHFVALAEGGSAFCARGGDLRVCAEAKGCAFHRRNEAAAPDRPQRSASSTPGGECRGRSRGRRT
jgi:hypothetical protein